MKIAPKSSFSTIDHWGLFDLEILGFFEAGDCFKGAVFGQMARSNKSGQKKVIKKSKHNETLFPVVLRGILTVWWGLAAIVSCGITTKKIHMSHPTTLIWPGENQIFLAKFG